MTDPTRPATGYPAQPQNGYPQQPPPHSNYYYPNHNPYYAPQYQPPRATFFRRFFAALIAVFIIFGTILFIVWLVLRPRVPTFTVDSVSVSHLNATASEISATFNIHFTVGNPNHKLHVYYDQVEARVFYKDSLIARNSLQPFDQGTKSQSGLDAELAALSAYIGGGLVGDLNGDRSKGTVEFDVQVLAFVRFKAGGWRARRRFLRVFCDNLPVAMKSNGAGTLSGGPRRCAVGI